MFRKPVSVDSELERALDATVDSLENILEFKEMAQTDGWKKLEEMLRRDVQNKLKSSFAMQADPVKNEKQLIINYAVCRTWERLLTVVQGTLNREPQVLAEIKRLAGKSNIHAD